MSLRARLLIGLVVVTAVGLIVAAVVTYAAERSFLINRVDQELVGNVHAFEDQVDSQLHLHKGPPGGPGDGDDFPQYPGPQGGGPSGGVVPPLGSYAIYIAPNGQKRSYHALDALSPPKLPAAVPLTTTARHPHLITVDSAAGSSLQYRVIAKPSDTGAGRLIVALPLSDVEQTLHRLRNVGLIVIGSVLLLLAAFSTLLIRLGLRPLDRMGATAGAIAAGDLSRRVEDENPRTEVGRLAIALNAMLGQIERAFAERQASEDRLRRFLSDASHELRTPLTSIRGYAELYRMGAASSPQEAAKAMERIEQEASRMGVLVEDLLALARLDELPVRRHERLDAAPLVRDAAEDARAAAPDREITAHADGEQIVNGDSSQLRQVLANLTRNALTHTPPGTPIELSVERTDGHVRIAVRDHGPGLPEGAGESVFERFWRAEGGRERGKAGAGLGLAIVAAIVEAHDGSVSAANAPGGGAQFVIELPAAKD
ncbi:MAG TPA: HAMP domain-containing sensor histidine kinase [Solirubrobacteraceae bacterium]|nr:HAMP domain-containing sensor histidine kinase [Solirubrobacteraceae bacterium]